MQYFILFVSTLSTLFLFGDLDEHLKKIQDKSATHSFHNIDFIYIINLDQRPEKLDWCLTQLLPYGIDPFRFSAVNGWELSLETINDVGLKFSPEMQGGFEATCYHLDGNFEPSHEVIQKYGQTYFSHHMSRGAIAIVLSHLSVLQDAYDSGYETIWVMEDDIEVLKDPTILPQLIDQLDQLAGKGNWDILFTDRDIRDKTGKSSPCYWGAKRPDISPIHTNNFAMRVVSGNFCQIGARWGAHSMIVRRSGMKKLLQYFKAHQIFFPYDMDFIFPPGIKLYTVIDDVVSNYPHAASDNGGPNYKKGKVMKWIPVLLSICSLAQALEITKAEDIRYDWLAQTGYTDHVPHFKKLFELVKVKTFLEFGLGYATKYFLDSCNQVISVEFTNPGYGADWMKTCLSLYRDYSNWIPILHYSSLPDTFSWAPYKYAGSEWIYKANSYQSATHKNYAEIDSFYLQDLDHFIGQLVKSNTISVAFVDPGIYLRGDLVQLLFNKVPIIAAHDTNDRAIKEPNNVYGYSRIVTPDNYEEIYILGAAQGTTLWILKNDTNQKLIEEMIQYAKSQRIANEFYKRFGFYFSPMDDVGSNFPKEQL